jgi:hypothetical protein
MGTPESPPQPKGWREILVDAAKVAPLTVLGWVFSLSHETTFQIVSLSLVALFVLIALVSPRWPTKEGATTLGNGERVQMPIAPKWLSRLAWGLAAVVLVVFLTVYFFLWHVFFPLGRIDGFMPSELVPSDDGKRFHMSVPTIVYLDAGEERAYGALQFYVRKRSDVKKVQVGQVRVIHSLLPNPRFQPLYGAGPSNVVPPNYFRAELPHRSGVVVARMVDEGKPIGGTILLDDSHPFAEIYISFWAKEVAFHYVDVEVTLTDEAGSRRGTVRAGSPILIRVHTHLGEAEPENADPPEK